MTMGRAHVHDLSLSGQGYICLRDDSGRPVWNVDSIPAEVGQSAEIAEVPLTLRDLFFGYGFGEKTVEGCYHWAEGLDLRWPGVVVMAPLLTAVTLPTSASQVSDIFEEAGELFALQGRYCYHIASNDLVATIDGGDGSTGKDFGATYVATKSVDFQGKTYVGFSSDHHIYSFDGTTWTQSGDDVHALYFCKDFLETVAGWRLVKAYGTNSIQYCAPADNPLTGASWGPVTAWTAGDTSTAITGLLGTGRMVYATKTDGLYAIDGTGRNSNEVPSVAFLTSSSNGVNPIYDGQSVLFPHLMGLLEYDTSSGSLRSVHPGDRTGNRSPIRGTVTAQTMAGPWHYVAMWNGTNSYLLAGRYPTEGESLPQGWVGPKIWHPLLKLTGVQCDCLHFSGLQTVPRLWLGYGTNLAYVKVPKSGNVIAELTSGNLSFGASGTLYLSPTDFGQAGEGKELTGVELENEGLSGADYVSLYVSIDGGSWVYVGKAQTGGRATLTPPSGSWRFNRIEFRLDVVNSSSTATIKLKAIKAKVAMRPSVRDLVTTTLVLVDGQLQRDNSPARVNAADRMDALQSLQTAGRIQAHHWWTGSDTEQTVMVHQVQPTIIMQKGWAAAGYGANVVYSVLRTRPDAWVWGGATWGTTYKWTI